MSLWVCVVFVSVDMCLCFCGYVSLFLSLCFCEMFAEHPSDKLGTSSGFQSFQFRLLENKLGIHSRNRIQYARQSYSYVCVCRMRSLLSIAFPPDKAAVLVESETAPTLLSAINVDERFCFLANSHRAGSSAHRVLMIPRLGSGPSFVELVMNGSLSRLAMLKSLL